MRLPNGYGSTIKLAGKRRKPWAVRITTGWEPTGKQIYKYISYHETKALALQALADYRTNPYNIDSAKITFSELYEKWSTNKFDKISHSNVLGYIASYKCCNSLYSMRFADIKSTHLQNVMDTCGKNYPTRRKLKVLFNQLYSYACQNDIVSKDYAQYVDIGKPEKDSEKTPFTYDEIQILWDNVDRFEYIDTIIIMIYSGWRIGELLEIKNSDIDLLDLTMKGGKKTISGKNRIVPIHSKILPLIKKRFNPDNEYFIVNHDGRPFSYYTYKTSHFEKIMQQLQLNHKPHECRHTFATLMDNAGANKLCIKRIMGHKSQDITDKVYTHKDIEELRKAIELI